MKILFLNRLDRYWEGKVEELARAFPEHSFISYSSDSDPKAHISDAEVIVKGNLSQADLDKARNLRMVVVPWTGVDGLPLERLRERGVIVSNTHENAEVVAERAVALALAVTGRVVELHNDLAQGVWLGRPSNKEATWYSIIGKRCSVLGLGKIGQAIAKLISGFECEITGFKRTSGGEFSYVKRVTDDIHDAVRAGDLVFVALPLTKKTAGIIGSDLLSQMKGKYLVNVSRGRVIEEQALYDALKSGTLAGAAIDVWYEYPSSDRPATLPSRYPIHRFSNVVMSPHVGSWSVESMHSMVNGALKNIESFLLKGRPEEEIDLDELY